MPANIASRAIPAEKPLVSVVIPTHNRAELLRQAIDSVYGQEGIGQDFRIEVIVVDDASTDSTAEVVGQYSEIHYVKLSANLGASGARNAGIKASSGKYVAFLDDDDLWLSHRLRVQVPVLEAKPSVCVVYGHGYTEGDGFSNVIWPDARWGLSGSVFEKFLAQDTADVFNIDTVLVRREAFDKAGYFDQSLNTMEHHDMMLRLAFYFPFEFITGPVTRGRLSKNGLFLTSISEGIYEQSYRHVIEKALALLPDTKEYSELRRKARRSVFAIVAELHWQYGLVEQLRSLVVRTLKENPWMLEEPLLLTYVGRLAGKQAADEEWPRPAIRRLWAEVKCAADVTGIRGHWRLQQLLADLLIEAAIVLIKKGSFKASAGLLLPSVLCDPTRLVYRILTISLRRFIVPGLRAMGLWHPNLLGRTNP